MKNKIICNASSRFWRGRAISSFDKSRIATTITLPNNARYHMNKKASNEIAIFSFVLAALLICGVTLEVMISFSNNFNSHEQQINEVLTEVQFNHQYVIAQAKLIGQSTLAKCPSCPSEQLKQKFKEITEQTENEFRYEKAGNFYGKIRTNDFNITQENGKYVLKIPGLFVESENGFNKIRRNFDLNMTLN
jgi:hypothetical protein